MGEWSSGSSEWASPSVLLPVCYLYVKDSLGYFYFVKVSMFVLWLAWPDGGCGAHVSDSRT